MKKLFLIALFAASVGKRCQHAPAAQVQAVLRRLAGVGQRLHHRLDRFVKVRQLDLGPGDQPGLDLIDARQFGYALRQGTGGALDLGPDVGEAVVAVQAVARVLERTERGGRHHQHGYARGDHQRDCQRLPAHVPQVAQRLAVDGFQAHHQCSSRAGRRSALTCSRPMRPSAM